MPIGLMEGDFSWQLIICRLLSLKKTSLSLRAGDLVYISGPCFTCRSRLHRYIFDEGHKMPDETKGRNVLIHTGPIVVKEDGEAYGFVYADFQHKV